MPTTSQYWERKKLESSRRGRRLSVSVSMGEWILGVSGTTCWSWLDGGGDTKGTNSSSALDYFVVVVATMLRSVELDVVQVEPHSPGRTFHA